MNCCHISSVENLNNCPSCDTKGKKIKNITPISLLMMHCITSIEEDEDYSFCVNRKCDVVYYSNSGDDFFLTNELSVKVTQKDTGLDVPVCYCFDHTRKTILNEIRKTGKSSAPQDIAKKMKDPGCFCEKSNPQGSCCLSNVNAWIKDAKDSLND